MVVRNEAVRLTLQDEFTSGMARAAAATALLQKQLDDLDGTSVKTTRSVRGLNKGDALPGVQHNAATVGKEVDRLSGRLRIFADIAAMVGPSLVPIGAVAVPAVAGLASQLGFAALAGGTALAAFQGVGDVLEAMNKAQLEPTADNLAEVDRLLADLSPAAGRFARQLHQIIPELKGVRDAGAQAMFPGLIRGFRDLDEVLPRIERLMAAVGRETGKMLGGGISSFGTERWAGFLRFLEQEAPEAIRELGQTIGNFTHGLAEMWMAFDPVNDDFSAWLLRVSEDFDAWSQRLSDSEGFREFVDYLRESGPQVASSLSAIGGALLDIAVAASPLGGPVLAALEAVAEAVSAIAESDIGTPLVAGAAAFALFNRAAAGWNALQGSRGIFGTFVRDQQRASRGMQGFTGDLGRMRAEYQRVGAAQAVMLSGFSQTTAAAQRTRSRLLDLGRTAGLVAGLGLAASGAADGIGMTNTASLALMGTLAGPWGSVIGGAIGAVMDLTSANDALETAIRTANATARDGTLLEMRDAQRELAVATAESAGRMAGFAAIGGPVAGIMQLLGDSSDEAAAASDELAAAMERERAASLSVAAGIEEQTRQIRGNIEAMRARRSEAIAAADAELGYLSAVNRMRDAVKENSNVLKRNGDLIDETNQDAIDAKATLFEVAAAWNSQSDAAKNADGSLRRVRRQIIDAATDMGMGEQAARRLANRILEIPSKKATEIRVETDLARQQLESFIRDSSGRTISIGTRVIGNTNLLGRAVARASGGPIFGPGTETSDSVLARLSHNEHVLSAREVRGLGGHEAVEELRAIARSAPRFATGGRVAAGTFGPILSGADKDGRKAIADLLLDFSLDLRDSARDVRREFGDLRRGIREAGGTWTDELRGMSERAIASALAFEQQREAVEASRDSLRDVVESHKAMAASLTDQLRRDPFGVEEPEWIASLDPASQAMHRNAMFANSLRADAARSEAYMQNLAKLGRRGLDGALLDFIAEDVGRTEAAAGWSRAQIRQYERLFAQRQAASAQAGQSGANAALGADVAAARQMVQVARQELAETRRQTKVIQGLAEQIARGVGREINNAAGAGRRKGVGS